MAVKQEISLQRKREEYGTVALGHKLSSVPRRLQLLDVFSDVLFVPSPLLPSKGSFSITSVNCWYSSQLFGCWKWVVSSELSTGF